MTVAGWVLIVVVRGVVPPTGVVVDGFATERACQEEAKNYCLDGRYVCKCEPGRVIK